MLNKIKPEIRIFGFSCMNYIAAGFMSTLTSVLMAYFAVDTNMTSGMQGLFLSMGGLMTAVVVSLPGRIVDRFGSKKVLICIGLGLIASLCMISTARSGIECMIWFSLYSLVTAASVPCSTQALKVYHVENPAKLLRINLVGSMVAGMVASSTAATLIEKAGLTWRQTFLVFGGISAVLILIGFIFMFSVKYDYSSVTTAAVGANKDAKAVKAAERSYKFTQTERMACIALCLLFIGYMGVGIALGNWMPAYLQGRGFTGMQVSIPNTVGKFVQLASYLLLPSIAAKLLKSTKVTPIACALLIVSIVGILVSMDLTVIAIARGLLALIIGFLSMHVQSDIALVAPEKAGGRFSSIVLASSNAGGVIAVILMGYLPGVTAKLIMFITFACLGIIGSALLIKPYQEIAALKKAKAEAVSR